MLDWLFESGDENVSAEGKTNISPSNQKHKNKKNDLPELVCVQAGNQEVMIASQHYIRPVNSIKADILERAVSNRQAMSIAAARYEAEMEKHIGKWIDDKFDRNRLKLVIECTSEVDEHSGLFLTEITDSDVGWVDTMRFSLGQGFHRDGDPTGDWIPFRSSEVSASEWLSWLGALITSRLQELGYNIPKEKINVYSEQLEIFVEWEDPAFWEACAKFDNESQMDAYFAGVPLEDILA